MYIHVYIFFLFHLISSHFFLYFPCKNFNFFHFPFSFRNRLAQHFHFFFHLFCFTFLRFFFFLSKEINGIFELNRIKTQWRSDFCSWRIHKTLSFLLFAFVEKKIILLLMCCSSSHSLTPYLLSQYKHFTSFFCFLFLLRSWSRANGLG